ncbi:MAG: inositol monophosphatase family protein [Patescibacteria group bacterium]
MAKQQDKNLSLQKLFLFGKTIAETVSEEIRKYSLSQSLGRFLKKRGRGGHQMKKGDFLSEKFLDIAIKKNLNFFSLNKVVVASEEQGVRIFKRKKDGAEIFLIIDPIDGSNNLRPHLTPAPFVAFSVALGNLSDLENKNNFEAISVAYIVDIFHQESWFAKKGGSAYFFQKNLKKIFSLQSSGETDLKKVIFGTSLDRFGSDFEKIHQQILPILQATFCQRRLGSTILDLCRVASGDYDIYFSPSGGVKIHDLAAVQLIIKEAGGCLVFKEVKNFQPKGKFLQALILNRDKKVIRDTGFEIIAAGNKNLLKKIKKL